MGCVVAIMVSIKSTSSRLLLKPEIVLVLTAFGKLDEARCTEFVFVVARCCGDNNVVARPQNTPQPAPQRNLRRAVGVFRMDFEENDYRSH